jgi:hypothetical protein
MHENIPFVCSAHPLKKESQKMNYYFDAHPPMKKLESPCSVLIKLNRFFSLRALLFSMPIYGGHIFNRYFSLQDLLLFSDAHL